jgi:hypothetical protein
VEGVAGDSEEDLGCNKLLASGSYCQHEEKDRIAVQETTAGSNTVLTQYRTERSRLRGSQNRTVVARNQVIAFGEVEEG